MDYDYSKIKGKIRELGLTQDEFAKYIGITQQTLSKRFENSRPFTQPEIDKAMKLFQEPLENIHKYFFTTKGEKVQQN